MVGPESATRTVGWLCALLISCFPGGRVQPLLQQYDGSTSCFLDVYQADVSSPYNSTRMALHFASLVFPRRTEFGFPASVRGVPLAM